MPEQLMRDLREWLADVKAMTALITRLPVGAAPAPALRSVRAMPVAGAVAGLVGGIALAGSSWIGLPAMPSAVAGVAALVLITGALHEDGLGDVADGFGGGTDVSDKLRIMRDSRLGSFGVCALALALIARVALVAGLVVMGGTLTAALAMVAAGALSRAGIVHILVALPPARDDGLAHGLGTPAAATRWQAHAVAGALAAVTVVPALGFTALAAAIAGAVVATLVVGGLARRQIGGQTGDVCGAVQQACEIAVMAGLAIAA